MYAALLVDVKRSKKYNNRERTLLQERIDSAVQCLNDLYCDLLIKKVGFSGGDEIQGLFCDPICAYMYYRLLSLTVGVGIFRCGIGVGAWDVRLNKHEESAAQDGEAYHLAREAIGEAARSDYYDLVCCGHGPDHNALTILLDHSWGLCKVRTEAQNEIALIAELLYPLVLHEGRNDAQIQDCRWCARPLLSIYEYGMRERGKGCGVARSLLDGGALEKMAIEPIAISRLSGMGVGRVDTLVGAAGEIAAAAGVTRQGVGRKISQGRLVQERRAIAFASRFYWGR